MLFYFCQFPHLPQEQLTMQIQNVIRNMISRQIQQQQWEQRSQVLSFSLIVQYYFIANKTAMGLNKKLSHLMGCNKNNTVKLVYSDP